MKVGYSRKLVVAVRESQSAATSMVTFPSGVYALHWVPSMGNNMIEWQNGITEWYDEWWNDIMTNWHNGIAKWHNRIAKWHNGIAKWRNGIAKWYFSIVEWHVANQPPYGSAIVSIGLKTVTCRVLFSDFSDFLCFYEQFFKLADMFPDHSIKSQLAWRDGTL